METIAQQVQKLREEIAMHDVNMMHGIYVIVALMIAAYIAAAISNKLEVYMLVLMLAMTTPFFVARQEYMIHRAGSYIRYTEAKAKLEELRAKYPPGGLNNPEVRQESTASETESWESWKGNLKSRVTILPALDLLAPIAVLYLILMSALALYPSSPTFTLSAAAGIVLGICAIPLVVMFAGK
jgi:hypothetical protein